jgi:predicted DNA-binding transcriptional regulator AlpA
MLNADLNRFLTTKQILAELGLTRAALDRMHDLGAGPPRIRIGIRRWGYRRGDLEKWLASRREDAASAATRQ